MFKPLVNRTVLVACSAKKMAELAAGLESMGAKVLPFPVIEAKEIEDKHLLDQSIASLERYDWIIFTSAYGVSFFMRRLRGLGINTADPLPRICAIGPATARAVNEFGHQVDLVPEHFVAEGIVEALGERAGGLRSLAGHRILIPRARQGRELLPEALTAAGALVDVVPCYETVRAEPEENTLRRLRASTPDLVVFTSSSTVTNMIDILGQEDGKRVLLKSVVAALGPVTAATVESFGKRPEIVPGANTIASLLEEIAAHFRGNRSTVDGRQ